MKAARVPLVARCWQTHVSEVRCTVKKKTTAIDFAPRRGEHGRAVIKLLPPMKTAFLPAALLVTLAASSPAADKQKPPALEAVIVVPVSYGGRVVDWDDRFHFHVIITNVSDTTWNVCNESCSWGYEALSFEMTDAKGRTWTVLKKTKDWLANAPDFWTIAPHGQVVLDVNLGDEDVWLKLQGRTGEPVYSVRAIFEIKPDVSLEPFKNLKNKQPPAWTGRVVSKPVDIKFQW